MELWIDEKAVTANPGESLLDLIRKLGLDGSELSNRPLAAKIAGEIFSLNYVPVRVKDRQEDRTSIRRAMAAAGGEIRLLRYEDPSGRDVYARTAQFLLFLAIRQLWPKARAVMQCTVGRALFIEVTGVADFSSERLKEHLCQLVQEDTPLLRKRTTTQQAIEAYVASGQHDKARILSWRKEPFFDQYVYGEFSDYHYGELAPSTGYLMVWDILPADNGLFFLYPDNVNPDTIAPYEEMPKFFYVNAESERWCRLMECQCIADLNELVQSGKIRQLIRVNEALHEKKFSQVADMVCQRGAKAVFLAGPSSSGKTTSANRLATQLRVHGKKPILMSLDDYYIDRDMIPLEPDGTLDLENIHTIDTALFSQNLQDLLAGKKIELPTFDFLTGKRKWEGHQLVLTDESVVVIEGLHALNPVLIPADLNPSLIFRLYVSALSPLNLDDHNRIPSSYLRLLRRTVRDHETRGSSVESTLSMWNSVRRGEKQWIFPYQENADVIFNSATLYELAILKKHIYPLLESIPPENSCYEQVRGIVKVLNYVEAADVDDEIPPTSLVREFIGGNSFYK